MPRIWLVLLLALSLWPSGAAASVSGPLAGPDEIHADGFEFGDHVLRSFSPLGSVLGLETRATGWSPGRSSRSENGGGPSLHLLASPELLLVRARLLLGRGVEDTEDATTPLCENLPYFATAPPSSR